MPALQVESHGIPAVATFATLLGTLLDRAEAVKPTGTIEPALAKPDFQGILENIPGIFADSSFKTAGAVDAPKKIRQYAIIETAVRDVFSSLIATTTIESPNFVKVWNLFDILFILSDSETCDPALLFWLIEELLDCQTIAGCRKVFDYLESRREKITGKHFNSRKLVILRSSNDLLRRLSRAEDTPFCGRVFIFLFHVFPLGDKSSVNLRGEYHVENVTTFDEVPGAGDEKMDVDTALDSAKEAPGAKDVAKPDASSKDAAVLPPDALYPVFWSLQASFSQPKRLFDAVNFGHFKIGLEATLAAFKQIQTDQGSRSTKQVDESKRGAKRKRDGKEEELADAYNPKYLTSRDLFELETSDLTFRRHFLVQAFIIMEFLLSLSAKAKEKLASTSKPNASVMYSDQLLSEENTQWVNKTKLEIVKYINNSTSDGAYFLRMVDTILARDKNWVRWKVESCPSIEMPPITAQEFSDAKDATRKFFSNRRLRSIPMGSLPLDFLDNGDEEAALEKLKATERYEVPGLDSFKNAIAAEDLEIEMPDSEKSRNEAIERKSSKTWRALRIASRFKLTAFDKIEDDNKIDAIFGDESESRGAVDPESLPSDVRPVILSGARGAGKSSLAAKLMERNAGVFGEVLQHTTKVQETQGHCHFVDSKTFDIMLDGDRFLEFSEVDGHKYGTSRSLIDAITDSGKVPLVQMNPNSVRQAKEMGYDARYVQIQPPSLEVLEARLGQSGASADEVQTALRLASQDSEQNDTLSFDKTIINQDLETACKSLEGFIYGIEDEGLTNGEPAMADVTMTDSAINGEPSELVKSNGAGGGDAADSQ